MMRELADNILDIAQNSISAGASLVEIDISVSHEQDAIAFTFKDDGCGMSEEMVKTVAEPFTTTRKTRKVGLGLPLLKQTALMTGGGFDIASQIFYFYLDSLIGESARILCKKLLKFIHNQ